jgi:hypothetical protein
MAREDERLNRRYSALSGPASGCADPACQRASLRDEEKRGNVCYVVAGCHLARMRLNALRRVYVSIFAEKKAPAEPPFPPPRWRLRPAAAEPINLLAGIIPTDAPERLISHTTDHEPRPLVGG